MSFYNYIWNPNYGVQEQKTAITLGGNNEGLQISKYELIPAFAIADLNNFSSYDPSALYAYQYQALT